ncbi:hypothetical protein TUMEXPCC7403_22765 [Tumidithrix helvetica PCC 7403]|uniref:DUF1565 domain-containing protein n=1 Tax=Tumidithrix helvetica TaxID=3457545 RepID=UPI003C8A08DF
MRRNSILPSMVTAIAIAFTSTALAAPFTFNSSSSNSLDSGLSKKDTRISFENESVIFVAPKKNANPTGNTNITVDGTEAHPFPSITAALSTNPPANTIIQLATGTYSVETGESFPIKLPQGVVLRGDPEIKGKGIVILGGGKYLSPTFAGQNVTILAGSDSRIEGITIENPNTRGTGVWVESQKRVTITNNTFTKNNREGVFLTGDANASVIDNLFSQNGANGLSAVGTSTGEIRFNTFDNTGFGLAIGQRSNVLVQKNRILNNMDGVVISNLSTPKLRDNLIANNKRNGLVVLRDRKGQPNPDLGMPQSLGGNIFKNNGDKDINNSTAATLVAVGNDLDRNKVAGLVALNPASMPTAITTTPTTPKNPTIPPVAALPNPKPIAPSVSQPTPKPSPNLTPTPKPLAATPTVKPTVKPPLNPVANLPTTTTTPKPAVVSPLPKPTVATTIQKPAEVTTIPTPSVVSPLPKPAVAIAPSPKPAQGSESLPSALLAPTGAKLQSAEPQPSLDRPSTEAAIASVAETMYLSSVTIMKEVSPSLPLPVTSPSTVNPTTPKPATPKPSVTTVAQSKPMNSPKPQTQTPKAPAPKDRAVSIASSQQNLANLLPNSVPIPQTFAFTQPLNMPIALLVPPSSFELSRYIVIIPSSSPNILFQVRSIVPTAQIAPSRLGSHIRVQGYPDRDRAEVLSAILRSLGLDSRVAYHSSL